MLSNFPFIKKKTKDITRKSRVQDVSCRDGEATVKSKRQNRGDPTSCPICGMIICNTYNLSCHIKRHNNLKPFKCEECSASFILKSELSRHSVAHRKDRPFQCSRCPKTFKDIIGLRIHKGSVHRINVYNCRHCDFKFPTMKTRLEHEEKIHRKVKYKCSFCPRKFVNDKYREEHEVFHKTKTGYDDTFTRKKKRIKCKAEGDSQEEEKLNKSAKRKSHNKGIFRAFDPDFKFYNCKVCRERFKFRIDQLSHYQNQHRDEFDKEFKKCKLCDKILTFKHYPSHMQAHQGIFPFSCTLCNYKSTRSFDLKAHMKVHTKEYTYRCSTCQKIFQNRSSAASCEKRHSGKKDVKCPECDKTFFSVVELRRHKAVRHCIRKCKNCDFETYDQLSFHQHKVLHDKEKKEKIKSEMCDKCGLVYSSKGGLKNHYNKAHLNAPSTFENNKAHANAKTCSYCEYQGNSSKDILRHCLKSHPKKVRTCTLCSYSTLNNKHFFTHIQGMTCSEKNLEPDGKYNFLKFECFICGFQCMGIDIMEKHIESHSFHMGKFSWFHLYDCVNLRNLPNKRTSNSKTINHGVSKRQNNGKKTMGTSKREPTEGSVSEVNEIAMKVENIYDSVDYNSASSEDDNETKLFSAPNNTTCNDSKHISTAELNKSAVSKLNYISVSNKVYQFKYSDKKIQNKSNRLNLQEANGNEAKEMENLTLNLNLNTLKAKMKLFHGKHYIQLEDLCSSDNRVQEELLKLFKEES